MLSLFLCSFQLQMRLVLTPCCTQAHVCVHARRVAKCLRSGLINSVFGEEFSGKAAHTARKHWL